MFPPATLEDAVRDIHALYSSETLLHRDGKNYCVDIESYIQHATLWGAHFSVDGVAYSLPGLSFVTLYKQCEKSLLRRISLRQIGKECFPALLELALTRSPDYALREHENFRIYLTHGAGKQHWDDVLNLKMLYDQCLVTGGLENVVFVRSFDPLHAVVSYDTHEEGAAPVHHATEPLVVDLCEPLLLVADHAEFMCYSSDYIKSTDGVTDAVQREKNMLVRLDDVRLIVNGVFDNGFAEMRDEYGKSLSLWNEMRDTLQRERTSYLPSFLRRTVARVFPYLEIPLRHRNLLKRMDTIKKELQEQLVWLQRCHQQSSLPVQILLHEPLLRVQFLGTKSDMFVELPS